MTTPYFNVPIFSWPSAPGGKLHSYQSGGTTPQATYSDAAGVTPNTNPVTLDSTGSAVVRLAVGVAYHMVLKDSLDVTTLWDADNIDNAYLTSSGVTAAVIGAALYPQTAAETAAGVTPTNYAYAPLDVRRYGALGDGVTNDAVAVQAAINVAKKGGGDVYLPAPPGGTPYLVTAMLDCTYAGNANVPTWGFRGDKSSPAGGVAAILIKHNQNYAFDCTGSYGITWQDFQLRCDPVTFPKVGWLLARNNLGGSQLHKFRGISVQGYFSDTCVYNFGSEQEVYEGCFFYNNATSAATNVLTWTANNYKAYTSSFVTIKAGAASTIVHQIFGGSFANVGGQATGHVFYIEGGADSGKVYGPWLDGLNNEALVYVDMTTGPTNLWTFDSITCEVGSNHVNGVLFSNHAQTPTGWTLTNWRSTAATRFLSSGALTTLDGFHIRHLSENATKGISVAGTLQGSVIEIISIIIVNNSVRNFLIGDISNWTITTRSNDYWIDTGLTNKSWTPALGTVAHGGVITFNENRCLFEGNMVHFEFLMTDTVSITATLAQTITGLPVAALRRSAMVLVANETTGAAIGAGFIEAGTTAIKMPAFSTGAGVSVCVSGSYFAA